MKSTAFCYFFCKKTHRGWLFSVAWVYLQIVVDSPYQNCDRKNKQAAVDLIKQYPDNMRHGTFSKTYSGAA